MDHVTLVTPFQGRSVVRRLTIDIACKHTKFDDASFSRSEDISWGVKFYHWPPDHDDAHLGDSWSPVFLVANHAQYLKSVALVIPKVFHGV